MFACVFFTVINLYVLQYINFDNRLLKHEKMQSLFTSMVYICKLFTTTEADFVSYAGKFTKSAEI